MSLTKEQLGWILIRGFGVITLVQLISEVSVLIMANSSRVPIRELGMGSAVVVMVGFKIAICLYFLGFGKTVHRLLMFESLAPANPNRSPVQVNYEKLQADKETGLMPDEFVEFSRWVEENPEVQGLPKEDQVARFRDFQNE